MPSRRLDPDTALEISLSGTANRLAAGHTTASEAARELRALADGRTDLLALAAGRYLGGFMANAGMTNPNQVVAAAYLVAAGADGRATVGHADTTRRRLTTPTTPRPTP